MPFKITLLESQAPHQWGIAVAVCNINDESDRLVATTVSLVRTSYGESAVVEDAEGLLADDIGEGLFDLRGLRTAIREGLPDPAKEGRKPQQLTNYRSQAAEMVAKAALSKAFGYRYPAAPQEGALNPNQPILGFDGWGILETNEELVSFALILVKATDVPASPPDESVKLAEECRRAPRDRSAILRALTVLSRLTRGDSLQTSILKMLEKMGRHESIPILVSPAIVRGTTDALPSDLAPIIATANEVLPASIRAIAISIGTQLGEFGELVMNKAREAI